MTVNLKYYVSEEEVAAVKALDKSDRDYLRDQINQYSPYSLFETIKGGKEIVCPCCGNGTGNDATGVIPSEENGKWIYGCRRGNCDFNGDLVAVIAKVNHLDARAEFFKVLAIGANIIGYRLDKKAVEKKHFPSTAKSVKVNKSCANGEKELELIRQDISEAQNALAEYLHGDKWRGLTLETLQHFHCGYIEKWQSPKSRIAAMLKKQKCIVMETPRIIVPSGDHYLARLTVPKDSYDKAMRKYIKPKVHAGTKFPFNFDAISAEKINVVVEGEIDAMSIWQITAGAVPVMALGGVDGYKRFIKQLKEKFPSQSLEFLILFDGDDTGRKDAPTFAQELKKAGYKAEFKFLTGDENSKVDANDMLQNDGGEKLSTLLNEIYDTALASEAPDSEKMKAIEKKKAEFETDREAAIEYLKGVESFDSETIFSADTIKGAAFAKLYDVAAFSEFKQRLSNYGREHKSEKISLFDFYAAVKPETEAIEVRKSALDYEYNLAKAAVQNKRFMAENDVLQSFKIPEGFEIGDRGVFKVTEKGLIPICRRPIIISRKNYCLEEKIYKLILSCKEADKWSKLPAVEAATVFNRNKLVDLANHGAPVTSSNAFAVVDFLDAWQVANEEKIPIDYVFKAGWQEFNGKWEFVDSRSSCYYESNKIVVEENSFTNCLKSKGSLKKWRQAYEIAKKSPIARLIVAAAVSTPLLKICGERNFMLYIYGKTRAGKSTALNMAISAVGDEKLLRSFDATKNGLIGTVAEMCDYPFAIDEKQVIDSRMQNAIQQIVYALSNGVGRTKLNKDSSLRQVQYWRSIILANGEVELLEDNVTGGAHSRLLQIPAPDEILSPEDCKDIRDLIKNNYGFAFPLVLDRINKVGFSTLQTKFVNLSNSYKKDFPAVLEEYCRYMALISIGDWLLNTAIEGKDSSSTVLDEVLKNALEIFKLIPTKKEISDPAREWDCITGFIAQNQKCFVCDHTPPEEINKLPAIYGKVDGDRMYISVAALKKCCKEAGFNYKKVVADMLASGKFLQPESTEADRTENAGKKQRIGEATTRCFTIAENLFADEESD